MATPSPQSRPSLVLGARASPLSRVQARLVGDALQARHAGCDIRYRFAASAGDRDLAAPLPGLLREGAFTGELSQALHEGLIDVAVHSWKDLPLRESMHTRIAATLPRADARDLLLVRRDWLTGSDQAELRVLSSSARRRTNLGGFLHWALPVRPRRVTFVPVRGDIGQRLGRLEAGDCAALVVAKAAIDRLLAAHGPEFTVSRRSVRAALAACEVVVLPLTSNPAAPGQGALAIEVRRDRNDLHDLFAAVNHEPTFRRVQAERAALASAGDEDHPLGVSITPIDCGEVEFIRGRRDGARVATTELRRHDPPLPEAADAGSVWTGEPAGYGIFRRRPLAVPHDRIADPRCGLFVARAEALPAGYVQPDGQVVWTAGLETWRKLAARGIRVHGSEESLGEGDLSAIRNLYPHTERWIKLSHAAGRDFPGRERVVTYRLERHGALPDVGRHTHFFWRSGSQFLEYLREYPRLRAAWHGAGPGHTLGTIRAELGGERVRAFLSADHFRREVAVSRP